jgi:predicted alpha/beta superfamily hydrolase
MKTHFPLVWLFMIALVASATGARGEEAKGPFPAYSIPGSEVRVLPRTVADREYQLIIGLPADFAEAKNKRYPVVFVTDGYWDFVKINSIKGSLVYDKTVPVFITVAIGYAGENLNYGELRCRDLSPVVFPNMTAETSGRAAEFLELIEKTIIPLVERDYRADPERRVLAGASMGGLFALYSLYTKPELFRAYIAATPATIIGGDWIFGYEEAFAKSGRTLDARLYFTVGEKEGGDFRRSIERFERRLESRKMPGLTYVFRKIEDEDHGSVQWESYVRGLRFAFAKEAKR